MFHIWATKFYVEAKIHAVEQTTITTVTLTIDLIKEVTQNLKGSGRHHHSPNPDARRQAHGQ
ncbi:MAG: hypothetical protein M2R45_00248 [Verrucomicrobia subdivision 3 bacterium]|nr:hypothetical protein [Limisphaerales bacterium]MCS1412993.1 hypothetical protein [Limisphaerales bacterium]